MKIITFSAIKGGVGKTTLTFNYGEWLASQGHHVLLVDADHQCSLTQTYDVFRKEGTLADVFTSGNVELISVKKNMSLIAGSLELDLINTDIQNKANKELMMYMWLSDNFEQLKQYDYVLIDCHPDFSTVTQNMIAVSDYVISPIEPGEYGFTAKSNIELRMDKLRKDVINVVDRSSFITADLLFLSNRIKHNTASSREFIEVMSKDPNTLGFIPEREVFNRSTLNHVPLCDIDNTSTEYKRNESTLNQVNEIFETITARMGDK